jgi:hypothetical protein
MAITIKENAGFERWVPAVEKYVQVGILKQWHVVRAYE